MAKAPIPVSQMRNLGPKTERMLCEAGIKNSDELRRVGAIEAYRRLKFLAGGVSLNALYAIEASLRGVDWRELSKEEKKELKRRANS